MEDGVWAPFVTSGESIAWLILPVPMNEILSNIFEVDAEVEKKEDGSVWSLR